MTVIIQKEPFKYQFQMMMVDQITRRSGGLTGLSALSSNKLLKKKNDLLVSCVWGERNEMTFYCIIARLITSFLIQSSRITWFLPLDSLRISGGYTQPPGLEEILF